MAKVCPECGREFENRSVRCPICNCDLEEFRVKGQSGQRPNGQRPQTQQVRKQTVQARQPQAKTRTNTQSVQRQGSVYVPVEKDGPSSMSITALVFSLLGCLSVVGLVLGIVDLCVNKHRKKVCSVLALVFSGLWIVGIAAFFGGSDSGGTTSQNSSIGSSTETTFRIGQTWVVDGQWKITINSVRETKDRNEYSEKTPVAVYIVDYTYENLGYVDSSGLMDGLFVSLDDAIVDSSGKMGYSYPADKDKYAQETPVGASCEAEACIGVDNAGTFKLYVDKYDGNGKKQSAIFEINP